MKIAGMTRLSHFDIYKKKASEVVKYCIDDLSKYCQDIYFLQIGEVEDNFLSWLDINKIITKTHNDYSEGWNFKNNESLDELYKSINKVYDWILYPDTDDIFPCQVLQELDIAEEKNADIIEFPILEGVNGKDEVIGNFKNYVIGSHAKALKFSSDITFMNSPGFAKPIATSDRNLKSYHCLYPCRHLRYSTKELLATRQSINYYQSYFLDNHTTKRFNPLLKFHEYNTKN